MPNDDCFVLLDDAVGGRARLFQHLQASDSLPANETDRIDTLLQNGWQRGWHAVLWLPYEFGLGLHTLPPNNGTGCLKLFWFAHQHTFNSHQTEHWLQQQDDGQPTGIAHVNSDTRQTDYLAAIAAIHAAIARGDTYQINYTTRLHFEAYGAPAALYRRLRARQPVPYGVLACLPQQNNHIWTLCLSPELFLRIEASGLIRTQPMKGTAPILHDGQDRLRAEALRQDGKNRAENVMIVDLLRNDLGRIAQIGQVRVPRAFEVTAYGNVWQMTSTVEAQAQNRTRVADILRATFPCGSITGAPKRMSMAIIRQLETAARGLYTGSIGHLAPCRSGLGFSGSLNVVIRTLQLHAAHPSQQHYRGIMGVGSGIVTDSEAHAEYAECHWKSHFLTGLPPSFALLETLAVRNGCCALLQRHQQRLAQAALDLHFNAEAGTLAAALQQAVAAVPQQGVFAVRFRLHADGRCQQEYAPLIALPATLSVLLHPANQIDAGFLGRYKTSHRAVYDAAWQQAARHGAFDTLLFDRDGYLLEGGRSNVLVRINGQWHTPGAELPILNGVMRQALLADAPHYLNGASLIESRVHYSQLAAAEQILLCNALRGVLPVTQWLAVPLKAA